MCGLPPFHEKMNKWVKVTATCLLEGNKLKGRQREREGGSVFFWYSLALKMHTPKKKWNV